MSKTLVIVESPGKISKISQYLGSEYIVKASYGHVQDLDKSTLSIEVNNNFKPNYIITPEKTKVVKELRTILKECNDVILASDGDREGEAIAYSLASVLNLKNPKRIIFNEITKVALKKAIENPSIINQNMVNAQQARRLLDRLVGYEISPILWNNMSSNKSQSAGRVQSVVVRIIIDKENEINKTISEAYYKTIGEFEFENKNEKIKLSATLNNSTSNKLYEFETEDKVKDFLDKITKKTVFKVILVENKKAIRKPSPPFITSSLQQEASTKLHFNVKKTMDIAQKLYEAGLITYMRSDSPNMSNIAIEEAKKYIIEKWGKEYSEPKNYQSKNATSQDAHECIRPTHMNNDEPQLENDQAKLYSLIWKRSIASQMSNAELEIQLINIDALEDQKSLLIINNNQTYFKSVLENIEFPGYLIVYDNSTDDEEKVIGKLPIKNNDLIELFKIKIYQEYTKPPLRYNEASLVKYLEKNGIGRPSTYASIISKVIERQYVEIKNIDGIKKESKQYELDKKLKIKELIKEISIGKEQKKLVPTEMGINVNNFMMEYFEQIMGIDFTATFEAYLDKIADGKANWITVLKTFYDLFHPIVEKLNNESKKKISLTSSDKLLGENENGQEIYTGSGKYGPYIKIKDDNDKWKYISIKEENINELTIDKAIELLEYPKNLGKIGTSYVSINKGPYGYYLKYGNKNISIKNHLDMTLEKAKEIIQSGDSTALKSYKLKDKIINIKNGEYGYYIQIVSNNKKQNIGIPKNYNIEKINIDDVLKIIASKNGTFNKSIKNNNSLKDNDIEI